MKTFYFVEFMGAKKTSSNHRVHPYLRDDSLFKEQGDKNVKTLGKLMNNEEWKEFCKKRREKENRGDNN